MQTLKTNLKTTLISLAIAGSLGSSLAVLADTVRDKTFEGLVVEDIVVIEKLPSEVRTGSVRVTDDDDAVMAGQAKLTSSEAATIATTALPGKVIETKLDNENDYLIWEVEIIDAKGHETQLKIDAGNGRLLAAEREDDEDDEDDEDKDEGKSKGSSWKFWEDNDRDELEDHD